MAKAVVTEAQDWREIARQAGGDPFQIMYDPSTGELEVPGVSQAVLDATIKGYEAASPSTDLVEKTLSAIDKHCRRLIAKGFEYPVGSRKILSLSSEAQIKWVGLFTMAQLPTAKKMIGFPLNVPTKDDKDSYDVKDPADVEDIYSTITVVIASHLGGAQTAKTAINAATTIATLETARDSYLNT